MWVCLKGDTLCGLFQLKGSISHVVVHSWYRQSYSSSLCEVSNCNLNFSTLS